MIIRFIIFHHLRIEDGLRTVDRILTTFLFIFGYEDSKNKAILGINYERHGVNFRFPPEVKIEYSLKLWKKIKDSTFITFNYENEHYRHYAFIDSNDNIWSQDFNEGSIQGLKPYYFH